MGDEGRWDLPRAPVAAYLIPKDLAPGTRVFVPDVIEDIVESTHNGHGRRLPASFGIWDGKNSCWTSCSAWSIARSDEAQEPLQARRDNKRGGHKMTDDNRRREDSHALFHPVEHAILCDWFQIERPEIAKDLAIPIHAKDDPAAQFGLLRNANRYGSDGWALANAVARLVLERIQDRLPQCALVQGDGEILLGRKVQKPQARKINVLPQFLFELNWADSGPGMSWPERYDVAFVPGYDRYVVSPRPGTRPICGAIRSWPSGSFQTRRTSSMVRAAWLSSGGLMSTPQEVTARVGRASGPGARLTKAPRSTGAPRCGQSQTRSLRKTKNEESGNAAPKGP